MAKKADLQYYGTGRRKSSVARVYVTSGTGKIVVNGRDVNEYMPYQTLVMDLRQPLVLTETDGDISLASGSDIRLYDKYISYIEHLADHVKIKAFFRLVDIVIQIICLCRLHCHRGGIAQTTLG